MFLLFRLSQVNMLLDLELLLYSYADVDVEIIISKRYKNLGIKDNLPYCHTVLLVRVRIRTQVLFLLLCDPCFLYASHTVFHRMVLGKPAVIMLMGFKQVLEMLDQTK